MVCGLANVAQGVWYRSIWLIRTQRAGRCASRTKFRTKDTPPLGTDFLDWHCTESATEPRSHEGEELSFCAFGMRLVGWRLGMLSGRMGDLFLLRHIYPRYYGAAAGEWRRGQFSASRLWVAARVSVCV